MKELRDIILYLFDTAHTLISFLGIYPPACLTFHKLAFVSRSANYYETLIPYLNSALLHAGGGILLKKHWKCSKALLLKTCHMVLNSIGINSLTKYVST